jgi:hypothetical protein
MALPIRRTIKERAVLPPAYCFLHPAIPLRLSVWLEGITVGILAANAPPPHLERRHVDGDDEQFAQVAGGRLERTHAVPGMVRALEKQAAISPRVYFRADFQVIEGWS